MGKKGKNQKKPKQVKSTNDLNNQEGKSNLMTTVSTALENKQEKTKPSSRKGK